MILLYMASRRPAAVIRANFLLYLLGLDLMLFAMLAATGQVVWPVLWLGLLAGVPNVIANIIGARLFDPKRERLFRAVAYIVIAASAILGLPLWWGYALSLIGAAAFAIVSAYTVFRSVSEVAASRRTAAPHHG